MNSISIHRVWWSLPIMFLALLVMRIVWNDHLFTDAALLFCFSLIGVYLSFFKKETFYALCIFFIPLSINTGFIGGSNLAAPSEAMVFVLGSIAIVTSISKPLFSKKILFHPISWLLALDILWMIIASFYSEMHFYSLKRVLARCLFILVFYFLSAQWMVKRENMLKYFLLYSLGLILPIFNTEWHHARYSFDPRTVFELCKPFFNDHTIYGASIAFVIPFVLILAVNAVKFGFSKQIRTLIWVLFGVLLLAEFLSYSRAAWISLMVSLMMYVFLKLKLKFWHFLICLTVVVIGFIWYQEPLILMARENENVSNKGEIKEHIMSVSNLNTDASNLERINRWTCAIRMFEDRPIVGFGPGTYQFVYGPYQSVYEMTYISTMSGDRGNAHSEPLTYLSETGLPGFISYLLWVLVSIGIGIRAYYRASDVVVKNMVLAALLGFMTFFFHGLVNSFIDQVKLAGLVFGSMAVFVVADISTRNDLHRDEAKKDS